MFRRKYFGHIGWVAAAAAATVVNGWLPASLADIQKWKDARRIISWYFGEFMYHIVHNSHSTAAGRLWAAAAWHQQHSQPAIKPTRTGWPARDNESNFGGHVLFLGRPAVVIVARWTSVESESQNSFIRISKSGLCLSPQHLMVMRLATCSN